MFKNKYEKLSHKLFLRNYKTNKKEIKFLKSQIKRIEGSMIC